MALLKELVYDVREALKEFSDDSEIDNRYIKYLYNIKRAKYLRQDLNNYSKTVDNSITQTFCLEMEFISGDECGEGCPKILRSKISIPIPLELHSKVAITNVKPSNRISVPFNFVTKQQVSFLEGSLFSNGLYAFLDNDNYIYIYSMSDAYKLLDCITVTGVFEDPIKLSSYKNCCNCEETFETCFDENDTQYPLQPHFIDIIKKEIINDLMITKQLPEDYENDANDR